MEPLGAPPVAECGTVPAALLDKLGAPGDPLGPRIFFTLSVFSGFALITLAQLSGISMILSKVCAKVFMFVCVG